MSTLQASAKEVSQLVRDTVRVLRLQHKTLARAFTQKNSGNMNEFFSILFLDQLANIQRLAEQTNKVPASNIDIEEHQRLDCVLLEWSLAAAGRVHRAGPRPGQV